MARDRDLSLLKLHLGSSIDLMVQMPVVSEVLKRLVPSFSLSMIRVDERCAPREHYSEFFDEQSHAIFASAGHQFAERTDDPAAFSNLLRNQRRCGSLLGTSQAFTEGATYQHLFKRNGIHHVLDVALRDGTGPVGILGIFREEDAAPFTRGDVATLETVYEHVLHAAARRPFSEDESVRRGRERDDRRRRARRHRVGLAGRPHLAGRTQPTGPTAPPSSRAASFHPPAATSGRCGHGRERRGDHAAGARMCRR